ncbi:hypothetical protein K402DRAFT_464736 [Aulographum hederae CBS 113979]|uniref:DH domain-containing protein n=1 Tax=Aulographum hederae CBS 113979 TaxID=1176131 RepID=A0A6G1GVW5_9PEZI|nr:hypothetical protein K402DRAFT_464736 [Aulographum hederae CBS 113979]
MVVISPPPPTFSPDNVSLFYVVDDLLARSPVLVFYGPSATSTSSATSSRIQAHVFSPAGLQSYLRLTIAPSSPLYAAVNCLPREEQSDDICRGLAFSLYKYFDELPDVVKDVWEQQPTPLARTPSTPQLFSEAHAAILASRMVKVENVAEVLNDVRQALTDQSLSWLDLDVVLPSGTIQAPLNQRDSIGLSDEDIAIQRYGGYAALVQLFGEAAFLPTSRLRRAPSRPTGLNRHTTFARKQKESLRREMCELLDTEENYVSKIYDLLHSVAEDFRQKAKYKSTGSSSPSEEALKGLFPPSLDKILEVNSQFLEVMRKILEETENDAIQDIENTTEPPASYAPASSASDVTGVVALAKCLLEWFPQFAECYSEYIHAHSKFSQHLKTFMKETGSSFSKRVQETGEQRLTSMLIEPVQRLPRYNLYIDNIVKQLPARYPATKSLLKARDIISEICSRDASPAEQAKVVESVRKIVPSWPLDACPGGRLITAVDVVELTPPYRSNMANPTPSMLLLFTDSMVILRKSSRAITARAVLAQLDNQNLPSKTGETPSPPELEFRQHLLLKNLDICEMNGGKALQLIRLDHQSIGTTTHPGSSRGGSRGSRATQVLQLSGSYENRASRLLEEVVKARVESRFTEAERESHQWEARSVSGGDLNIFGALFEGQKREGRGAPAKFRLIVNPTTSSFTEAAEAGAEVVVALTILSEGFYRMEVDPPKGPYNSRDHLTAAEFLPVLRKRLSNVLQMRNQIRNPAIAATLLLRNQHILQSLRVQEEEADVETPRTHASRPHSPVKMISNLFGGSVSKDVGSPRKHARAALNMSDIPRMMPPRQKTPPAPQLEQESQPPLVKPSFSSSLMDPPPRSPSSKLEDTLASYVLALHARKGNIVGKTLRARALADELSVNELYNSLLEDPSNCQLAAQASVDVLLMAFEKFLKIAWKEKMGPVISHSAWISIQSKSDSSSPAEFEDFFRMLLNDMPGQNQIALRSIVKLLADLLDGTSNDGDRGLLTAVFTEMLVSDGNAHDFISLSDRFVEDVDALFGEQPSGHATPSQGSVSSATRHFNMGSLNSASSLRRKFGFGTLTRKNSKLDSDSEKFESTSVWRQLSKSGRGNDSQPSSVSKGTANLNRSRSTDLGQGSSPKRPVSRDRPAFGGSAFEQNTLLGTIGENTQVNGPPRKKRRSSLSDLQPLQMSGNNTPAFSTPRRLESFQHNSVASPRTPSPAKASSISSSIPTPTGPRAPSSIRGNSPAKENVPFNSLPRPSPQPRPRLGSNRPDSEESIMTRNPIHRRQINSVSGIPSVAPLKPSPPLGSGLTERPSAANISKTPRPKSTMDPPTYKLGPRPLPVPGGSPEKRNSTSIPTGTNMSPERRLKMQSPQKLRERLQNENKALNDGNTSLSDELDKIGDDIGNIGVGTTNTRSAVGRGTIRGHSSTASTTTLISRVAAAEARLTTLAADLTKRQEAVEKDIASSLQVSEARVRKLDDLLREANAENDALYAKFNEEISKVIEKVRRGEGDEEVRWRSKEMEEENARLRRDNARLKREAVGLRAQLRG